MNTSPRLPPIPSAKPAATPIPFRLELRAVVRDGYACTVCGLAVVADDTRRVVRLDPAAGDQLDNVATLCERCADLEVERQQQRPAPP
jgi:5-methylcytosine-specific restriction endonuclease McrA